MRSDVFTGLPFAKKKTRRGKRHPKSVSEHMAHLRAARECAECGDHKGAKNAAFKFIKALPNDEPEMEHNAVEEAKEPKKTLSPAMKALLARRK